MAGLAPALQETSLFGSSGAEPACTEQSELRLLLLVRLACPDGATLTELVRDFAVMTSHRLSTAQWRARAGQELANILDDGLAVERRLRIRVTQPGLSAAEGYLGRVGALDAGWLGVRDGRLVARALGLAKIGPKRLAEISKPDGLRAVILRQHYGLSARTPATPAKLRGALARVALERSFGDAARSGLSEGDGFTADDGRQLAAQLCAKPRRFDSDSKLIALLAAEAVGAKQTDLEALRTTLLRRLFDQALPRPTAEYHAAQVSADNDAHEVSDERIATPLQVAAARPAPALQRPTLVQFAEDVLSAAQTCADGWPGNFKALISEVWPIIEERYRAYDLNIVTFKAMLIEAHLMGLVSLTGSDLKGSADGNALRASEITYKNTVWHQIRIDALTG